MVQWQAHQRCWTYTDSQAQHSTVSSAALGNHSSTAARAQRPRLPHQLDAGQVAPCRRQRERRVAILINRFQVSRPVGPEAGIVPLQVCQQRLRGSAGCRQEQKRVGQRTALQCLLTD